MKQFLKYSVFLMFLSSLSSLGSCVNLKSYEKVYVNDPEMTMGASSGKSYLNYIHSIREGANPAGTAKSSGGCGCN
ncbi:MAG: DUF4266 domain-containing protein [Cyclobacteriaceae bacterium]|nr:DUF4266 domain-containing protein [Cyclobacteriaceae bacterium]